MPIPMLIQMERCCLHLRSYLALSGEAFVCALDSLEQHKDLWNCQVSEKKTSQELRMLSRSLSDCKPLLLNLDLNLNLCLCSDCSDCSDCSANIVSWLQPTDRQCQLLSCPGQLKNCYIIIQKWGAGSKAVLIFSKKSSNQEAWATAIPLETLQLSGLPGAGCARQ